MHYRRTRVCSEEGCGNVVKMRGRCQTCHQRRVREAEIAARASSYGGADTPFDVFLARQRAALACGGRMFADPFGRED